ncbi:hypothetical protein [Streptomyces sp. 7N604]|uniref:hypothetical protein n=1 Tax=Streptomyces sp. 7N604 TaxID=3457415 RepID=UPI003FD556FF
MPISAVVNDPAEDVFDLDIRETAEVTPDNAPHATGFATFCGTCLSCPATCGDTCATFCGTCLTCPQC